MLFYMYFIDYDVNKYHIKYDYNIYLMLNDREIEEDIYTYIHRHTNIFII